MLFMDKNRQNQNVLHAAAMRGDKHFCTMLIQESFKLFEDNRAVINIEEYEETFIDVKDINGLSPFFYLCIDGYRKERNQDETEEMVLASLAKTSATF
jgi:ankyrin repeat protein